MRSWNLRNIFRNFSGFWRPISGIAGGQIDVEIGVALEQARDVVDVLGVVAEVNTHERYVRVASHDGFKLLKDLAPRRKGVPAESPVGVLAQLVVPLVLLVDGQPECRGVSAVD
jgi:hypothetical protein